MPRIRAGTIEMPTRAAAASLAWPEPMISFDAVPLAEAVAAFNRSGGRRVRLEGEGLSALRVSGAFRRDDPQGFVDGLTASFGLHFEQAGDGSLTLPEQSLGVSLRALAAQFGRNVSVSSDLVERRSAPASR